MRYKWVQCALHELLLHLREYVSIAGVLWISSASSPNIYLFRRRFQARRAAGADFSDCRRSRLSPPSRCKVSYTATARRKRASFNTAMQHFVAMFRQCIAGAYSGQTWQLISDVQTSADGGIAGHSPWAAQKCGHLTERLTSFHGKSYNSFALPRPSCVQIRKWIYMLVLITVVLQV